MRSVVLDTLAPGLLVFLQIVCQMCAYRINDRIPDDFEGKLCFRKEVIAHFLDVEAKTLRTNVLVQERRCDIARVHKVTGLISNFPVQTIYLARNSFFFD